jgi:hypothetical protein
MIEVHHARVTSSQKCMIHNLTKLNFFGDTFVGILGLFYHFDTTLLLITNYEEACKKESAEISSKLTLLSSSITCPCNYSEFNTIMKLFFSMTIV